MINGTREEFVKTMGGINNSMNDDIRCPSCGSTINAIISMRTDIWPPTK